MATASGAKAPRKKGAKSVVREYFDALGEQDVERAVACWKPGGTDHLHGLAELAAPDGIRAYFNELFAAFPDFRFEVIELTGSGEYAAGRWRTKATFNGSGRFQGIAPNGARVELEGCDMFRVLDEKIVENHAYTNAMDLAQQLGVLPPAGSALERAMTGAFNVKTAATGKLRQLRGRG